MLARMMMEIHWIGRKMKSKKIRIRTLRYSDVIKDFDDSGRKMKSKKIRIRTLKDNISFALRFHL